MVSDQDRARIEAAADKYFPFNAALSKDAEIERTYRKRDYIAGATAEVARHAPALEAAGRLLLCIDREGSACGVHTSELSAALAALREQQP